MDRPAGSQAPRTGSAAEVFRVFLGLGLTSFGGPVAHLGYFRGAFVVRRKWLTERAYADLVALCQFLPGPASSQACMAIGLQRAGYLGLLTSLPNGLAGAAIALVAIFLPSALLIIGGLPFWDRLRGAPLARSALAGVNAAVVGLLAAALYDPVFTEGVTSPPTMALAAASFVLLAAWRTPAWAVVIAAGAAGLLFL